MPELELNLEDNTKYIPSEVERLTSQHRKFNESMITLFLLLNPCVGCGDVRIRNLEFHHINPVDKKFNVGSGLDKSSDDLYEEMMKCEVLCKLCHYEVTHSNTYKDRVLKELENAFNSV